MVLRALLCKEHKQIWLALLILLGKEPAMVEGMEDRGKKMKTCKWGIQNYFKESLTKIVYTGTAMYTGNGQLLDTGTHLEEQGTPLEEC